MRQKLSSWGMHIFFVSIAVILFSTFFISSCKKGSNADDSEHRTKAVPLNLSDENQQIDFQGYLQKTVAFLNDPSHSIFFNGYNPSNLTDNDKRIIANRMIRDEHFMKRLNLYQRVVSYTEKKYQISAFTKEQWNDVVRFGMKKGIYYLPGLNEKVKSMEEKSRADALQNGKSSKTTLVDCCPCSDLVDQANADLAVAVAGLSVYCLSLSSVPVAAAFCWAGVAAFYISQNAYINSNDYWCQCMFEHYGVCVY